MNRFLKGYQNQNNLIGWAIFVFALVIYAMTMEQTASLWDCGEFIAGAYKLEVVHALALRFMQSWVKFSHPILR